MLIRSFEVACDLLALQRNAPRRYPCLLESAARGGPQARFDLLLAFPQSGLRLDRDGVTRSLDGVARDGDFLANLDREWQAARSDSSAAADRLPFRGGWAMFLGYELAGQIEPRLRLAAEASGIPVALALRCPVAVLRDHAEGSLTAIAEPGFESLLDQVGADIEASQDEDPAASPSSSSASSPLPQSDDPARFLVGVQRILDYIAAGDVFQVNLSRGWQASTDPDVDAAAIYAALRRANPAPFAGSFRWDDWAVLSSSPERLVSVRGRDVQTRPIAGTRARDVDDDEPARIRELIGHPKERAEHIMLIDLERNDHGRVCEPGSVRVDELMTVESYAHVHHIVSNVSGRLRPDAAPGEVIRAVFPGGTITGCPKVRCMEIIAELEEGGRGPYTGAFGYLDRSGDLDLNILIRTLWLREGVLRFRAGAGIVADSEPAAELEETRAKARGLLRALGSSE
jgi:anthranilate synthase component 1